MRYGLPDVDAPPVAQALPREPPRAAPPTPLQLLAASLQKFDSLYISQATSQVDRRRRQHEGFCRSAVAQSQLDISAVEQQLRREAQRRAADVQKVIAHQKELQRQRELELKRLQEEKARQEREAREKAERERKQREEAARKQAEEEKRQAEEAAKQKAERAQQDAARKAALEEKIRQEKEAAGRRAKGFTLQAEVEKLLVKHRQDVADIKRDVVDAVNGNKELKKQVGVVKRKINVKLGQLSNSVSQVSRICAEVTQLALYTQGDPLAFKWILNFIAKAIVSQAEAEVTVKPTAALPLGRLAVHLLHHLPGFYYFLCARFVKKCCFVIGYTGSIDTEEGRTRMGWKRADGKWEAEVKYEERVGGILTVWAVVSRLQLSPEYPFFSMEAEWMFLARILNTDLALISNAHYVVVCNWWEAAAQLLVQKYGRQAQKLLHLTALDWVQHGSQKSYPAATRLQVLGEDLLQKQNYNSLKEMEP